MKNRVHFKNLVVSAEDLPKINQIIRLLTEFAPSDAFISIEFCKSEFGFSGTLQLNSPSENFSEEATHLDLVPVMTSLSLQSMVHIKKWRENRFEQNPEKVVS
jgi:hypothetical protein